MDLQLIRQFDGQRDHDANLEAIEALLSIWLVLYGERQAPRLFLVYLPRENTANWQMLLARKLRKLDASDVDNVEVGLAAEVWIEGDLALLHLKKALKAAWVALRGLVQLHAAARD